MNEYKAKSTNAINFDLTLNDEIIGKLAYAEWYTFNANIQLKDGKEYQLRPKGFWNSIIELKDLDKTLLDFRMGWKGIVIKTYFGPTEESYLLSQKGLLSNKFSLIDQDQNEVLVSKSILKWKSLNYDYSFETSSQFETIPHKEALLLTVVHCINYYLTTIVSAT